MKNYKLSIDLTEENRLMLEKNKKERNMSYGNTVNVLIQTFTDLPKAVKNELTAFIKAKIRSIYREMNSAGEFGVSELSVNLNAYLGIAKYLDVENQIFLEESKTRSEMSQLTIKDGILIYPDDYILVNPEAASTSMYAGVVECRNSEKYGMKHFGESIPHFLFLCDKKYGNEYDDDFYQQVNRLCMKAWPRFKDVIKAQVTAVDDPDKPGQLINKDEWVEAPTIGYFAVYEHGDEMYGADYQPPEGVRIVRKKKR